MINAVVVAIAVAIAIDVAIAIAIKLNTTTYISQFHVVNIHFYAYATK
jgi:hypothetical protein